jgi:hypothetical protein
MSGTSSEKQHDFFHVTGIVRFQKVEVPREGRLFGEPFKLEMIFVLGEETQCLDEQCPDGTLGPKVRPSDRDAEE